MSSYGHPRNSLGRFNFMYSSEQEQEFCELAAEIGVREAMKELGYPSRVKAYKWIKDNAIELPTVNPLLEEARARRREYDVKSNLLLITDALEKAFELLETVDNAKDMKSMADTIESLTRSKQLLEGKATAIDEVRQQTQQDVEINALIDQMKQKERQNNDIF